MGRYVFKLPDVGEGTAEAELVAWHVAVGDTVAEDQILADVMTDKATVELTSPVAGTVTALHGEPGVMSPVGGPLVEFEVEGAGNSELAAQNPSVSSQELGATSPSAEADREETPPQSLLPIADGEGDREAVEGSAARAAAGNYVFKLPDVGEGTAEAELVAWHVAVGDAVTEDQLLAEVMTDKATVELTSPVAGVVTALHGEAGTQVPVGGPLVRFDVEGPGNVATAPKAAAPAPAPAVKAAPEQKTEASKPKPAPAASVAPVTRQAQTPGVRPLASPAVRKRARELGVELQFVPGSGPAGRIEHGDLDAFLAGGSRPAAPTATGSTYARAEGTTEVRIIGLRRKIAEKMAESVRRIPHITY
ncbi:MAG: E3 binding domain-containing protein, partial [Caulobacteraceae bacterium]|nr:E3 binding domain-containing protein [Caulobacteraceae bacterium]